MVLKEREKSTAGKQKRWKRWVGLSPNGFVRAGSTAMTWLSTIQAQTLGDLSLSLLCWNQSHSQLFVGSLSVGGFMDGWLRWRLSSQMARLMNWDSVRASCLHEYMPLQVANFLNWMVYSATVLIPWHSSNKCTEMSFLQQGNRRPPGSAEWNKQRNSWFGSCYPTQLMNILELSL